MSACHVSMPQRTPQVPGTDGFQLWYMVEPPKEELAAKGNLGNMFMVRTPELKPTDSPVYWRINEDGSGAPHRGVACRSVVKRWPLCRPSSPVALVQVQLQFLIGM